MLPYMAQQQVLFEFDEPQNPTQEILNYSAGVYKMPIAQTSTGFTDDYSVTGYYDYTNSVRYYVSFVTVDGAVYSRMASVSDCELQDSSFYFDTTNSVLYIHFVNAEPPLNKVIIISYAIGYSKNGTTVTYNGWYFEPRLDKVYPLKNSIDPLFYGLLKYQGGQISLINTDGEFDDWRTRNMYGQGCRVLSGDAGAAYSALSVIREGFIENDSRSWQTLNVTMQDKRKSLTTPIAANTLSTTDYAYLNSNNVGKVKPIAYGTLRNAPALCLNGDSGSTSASFLFMDTTYNEAATSTAVYCNGEDISTGASVTWDLTTGTFTASSTYTLIDGTTVGDNLDEVTIDFTTSITNGVDIIKDIMHRYGGYAYLASFYDTTEVAAAQASARDTSLYISENNKKLSECIESVCNDLDARFYCHDNGLFTIRLFDDTRAIDYTIEKDEWLDDPDITNDGSEFLTSAVVLYSPDIKNDTYRRVENTYSRADAYARYKTYKTEEFKTNLIDASAAMSKAINIMLFSENVADVITRTVPWTYKDIEITDFVLCDPLTRVNETEVKQVYEVIGISKDLDKLTVQLTLRYIKADPTTYYNYYLLVDETGQEIITEADQPILIPEAI